jgi:putrescine transport system substrate-binding protein
MRLPLVAVLLALASMPAFGQGKGQVNVYNWSDYIAEDQLKAFEKNTGIKVNYTTYDSNEILEAKLRAGRSGYDVVVPTASPFFVRQLAAGLYKPLDKSKLGNLKNIDPEIMAQLAKYDPGNAHAIPWMWGTTGIGFNVEAIRKRLPDAPTNSLRMIFDPEIVSKFKDCGVMLMDSPTDVLPAALLYLGLDPDSKAPADLEKARDAVMKIRPHVRKIHTGEIIDALAGGDVCLAFAYSGDILQARDRGAKAAKKQVIEYAIPREGAQLWIDVLAIPKSAKNVDNAHRWLDYMLEPKVAAESSNLTGYANANRLAPPLMNKAVSDSPLIYPPRDVRAKLYTISAGDAEHTRLRTRAWTTVKTGR